jgi:hypothetical protein
LHCIKSLNSFLEQGAIIPYFEIFSAVDVVLKKFQKVTKKMETIQNWRKDQIQLAHLNTSKEVNMKVQTFLIRKMKASVWHRYKCDWRLADLA